MENYKEFLFNQIKEKSIKPLANDHEKRFIAIKVAGYLDLSEEDKENNPTQIAYTLSELSTHFPHVYHTYAEIINEYIKKITSTNSETSTEEWRRIIKDFSKIYAEIIKSIPEHY